MSSNKTSLDTNKIDLIILKLSTIGFIISMIFVLKDGYEIKPVNDDFKTITTSSKNKILNKKPEIVYKNIK